MASPPRQLEVNGIYHIYNRGYDKRDVYLDDKDYLRFIISLYWFNNKSNIIIDNLAQEEKEFPLCNPPRGSTPRWRNIERRVSIVEILAFVQMPNHYHLILKEITEGGISLFMRKLSNGYTGYFNEKYDRKGVGGIFQGRYQSVRIKDDRQLASIFNYVHTNPVELVEPQWKDLIVKNKRNALNFLDTYKWSSYHDYIGNSRFPNVTQRDFYSDLLGGHKSCHKSVEDWVKFKAENNILRVGL